MLALKVGLIECSDEIVGVVDDRVNLSRLEDAFGIVAMLSTNEAENGLGFVVVIAVLDPHWQLSVGELTGSLSGGPLIESDLFVLIFDLTVRKKHLDGRATSIKREVNEFGH